MKCHSSLYHLFLLVTAMLVAMPALAAESPRDLLQLADYIGVDYAGAVKDGEVVNPSEYAEMTEFAGDLLRRAALLPPAGDKSALLEVASRLRDQVTARADPARVRETSSQFRQHLEGIYDIPLTPSRLPDLPRGAALYQQQCVSCHGVSGRGDGPLAATLVPKPIDFHDRARQQQRSLFSLFNTIGLGVKDTDMRAYTDLSEQQRWDLAFYIGAMQFTAEERQRGEQSWQDSGLDLLSLSSVTPQAIANSAGEAGLATIAYLRANPQVLSASGSEQIRVAIDNIAKSVAAYRQGQTSVALKLAVAAYLDGFELAENALKSVDPQLLVRTEGEMMAYRQALRTGQDIPSVTSQADALMDRLHGIEDLLGRSQLSPGVAFASSFFILAREGLEAILVLGAIAAFVVRTGRRDALRYLHLGWISALGLGVVTWFISTYLFTISGATRELTEGLTALLASVVLFYVGFWMHNKLSARQWTHFVQTRIKAALDEKTLWGLAFMAFLAVYREVFEIVLFYQTLLSQVTDSAQHAVFTGAIAAAGLLAGGAWVLFRFGIRLPLRTFFMVSAAIMLVLSIVFAGKGVVALQEAGILPVNAVPFPRIDILGIYPNLESLGMQLAIILLGVMFTLYSAYRERQYQQAHPK